MTGPEAPEPLDHVSVESPSFADLAAQDTDTALRHEHEAVERIEDAAAAQIAELGEPGPGPDNSDLLPDQIAAEAAVDSGWADHGVDVRQDAANFIWGMPVPGVEPPR